ncbi:TPA: hypothetical protein KPX59_000933 [Staphylococcus aureus]|nr:hypothetical protein [Staphylococcus aureus]HCX9198824.1 hypothetical protein [Staphylococcus aureus]
MDFLYEAIVVDFNGNYEVCRFTGESRKEVEDKVKSLVDDEGTTYKVFIIGHFGYVGEVEKVPDDIKITTEILNLKLS